MATSQLSGVPRRADQAIPMSDADVRAHDLSTYVRPAPVRVTPVDSDPNMRELLRRARASKAVSV